jgi:transcriptional regulator with XRE-family HTH domain
VATDLLSQRILSSLKAEMARRDVTGVSLAKQLGRSQQFVSRRLAGKVPLSVDDLAEFASAIGIPVAALVA